MAPNNPQNSAFHRYNSVMEAVGSVPRLTSTGVFGTLRESWPSGIKSPGSTVRTVQTQTVI